MITSREVSCAVQALLWVRCSDRFILYPAIVANLHRAQYHLSAKQNFTGLAVAKELFVRAEGEIETFLFPVKRCS
jgi:hypothetical protein